MGRRAPRQVVKDEVTPVYGPEPVGASQTRSLNAQYLRDMAGLSNPVSNYPGPTGSPEHTVFGDLGPLQGDYTPVRTVAAKDANRPGFGASLPSTAGGEVQDKLGALGI